MSDGNLSRTVTDRVIERARDIAKQMAKQIGTPADSQSVDQSQQIALWNMPNPQADPAQVQQLIDAGQHAQALDMAFPWRSRLIGSGSPEKRAQRAEAFARMAAGQGDTGDLQPQST